MSLTQNFLRQFAQELNPGWKHQDSRRETSGRATCAVSEIGERSDFSKPRCARRNIGSVSAAGLKRACDDSSLEILGAQFQRCMMRQTSKVQACEGSLCGEIWGSQ